MSAARKELVWGIKKQLFRLSSHDIYQVAKDIAVNSQHEEELNANDEEGCMEYVVSYMQSDTLLGLEDGGMGQLLVLNDLVGRIINADAPVNIPVVALSDGNTHVTPSYSPSTTTPNSATQPYPHSDSTVMQTQPPSNTHIHTTTQPLEELRQEYEELGEKLRRRACTETPSPTTYFHQAGSELHYMPQGILERPVMLKDLSYLQRRDFKVHGGQVGDQNSDLNYSNISKQIEGVKEGFAEAEVVRGVLRIIKPGAFKDMLMNKDSITVPELKSSSSPDRPVQTFRMIPRPSRRCSSILSIRVWGQNMLTSDRD